MSNPEPALSAYEQYIVSACAQEDEALRLAREEIQHQNMPLINVSASEGKLLQVLARSVGARRILEIGTLGGYSAIWLARAMPAGGKLISLEIDAHHAEVARKNIARAGLSAVVEVRLGPALQSLDRLAAEGAAPFDVIFIDADKETYPEYLQRTFPLVRAGGLILADNAIKLSAGSEAGIPRYNAAVAAHRGLTTVIIPVLRGNGIDGLSMSVKSA